MTLSEPESEDLAGSHAVSNADISDRFTEPELNTCQGIEDISISNSDLKRRSDLGGSLKQILFNPIALIFITAIAAHAAFWVFLPNPIRQDNQVSNPQKIPSVRPIINPLDPPTNLSTGVDLGNNQIKNPLSLPTSPTSSQNKNPLSLPALDTFKPTSTPNLPPPLLSLPPQDLPSNYVPLPVPSSSNLTAPRLSAPSSIPRDPSSNLNFPVTGSNLKLDRNPQIGARVPSNSPSPSSLNPNLIDNSTSLKPPAIVQPQAVDPLTGFSTTASDLVIPSSKSDNKSN
jgi:hypothetical protein